MKILLINPKWLLQSVYGPLRLGQGIFAPLGLISCAAVLEEAGYDVSVLDAQAMDYDVKNVSNAIDRFDPDIVGLTATTPIFSKALEIAKIAKEKNKITVCGGVHAGVVPDEVITSSYFDYVVRKEGEYTLLELVESIEKNKPLKNILGLTFKKNGKIFHNPDRPFIDPLSQLPMPAYHLIPIEKYRPYAYQPTQKLPFINIMTSRGCPFHCTFCTTSYQCGRRLRALCPEAVIDQLNIFKNRFGITNFMFFDDIFTLDQKRTLKICELIIKEKLDITWNCLAEVNCVTPEILRKMKDAGCEMIAYGVESGNQNILNAMKKGITINQIRKAFKWAKEADIVTRAFFILGYFGETMKTIRKTIEFAKELDPDFVNFGVLTPFPKTEVWEISSKNGLLPTTINWDDFSMFDKSVKSFTDGVTRQELEKIMKNTHKEFYLRLPHIFKSVKNIKSLAQFLSYIRGTIGVIFF